MTPLMTAFQSLENRPAIYRITLSVKGKNNCYYIGQASRVRTRLWNHQWHLSKGSHACRRLMRAFNKYGPECFFLEILEDVDLSGLDPKTASDLLSEREFFWISSHDQGSLLNVLKVRNSKLGATHTKEARRKISLARRGSKASDLAKARMSAAHKGKIASEASKEKMREAQRRIRSTPGYKDFIDARIKESWNKRPQSKKEEFYRLSREYGARPEVKAIRSERLKRRWKEERELVLLERAAAIRSRLERKIENETKNTFSLLD